uniref:Ig-like domain-containing protein n=1 Tax=Kryptolebias marmoratus TaxID=37003 RepID=A0A3Q3A2V1_KRYMA
MDAVREDVEGVIVRTEDRVRWRRMTRETVTLSCQIQGGGETQWTYVWRQNWLKIPPTSSEYRINKVTESHSGEYRCRGRTNYLSTQGDPVFYTEISNEVTIQKTGEFSFGFLSVMLKIHLFLPTKLNTLRNAGLHNKNRSRSSRCPFLF